MNNELLTRLRERAGEAKKSLVRDVGGLLDMSNPMAIRGLDSGDEMVVLRSQKWRKEERERGERERRIVG